MKIKITKSQLLHVLYRYKGEYEKVLPDTLILEGEEVEDTKLVFHCDNCVDVPGSVLCKECPCHPSQPKEIEELRLTMNEKNILGMCVNKINELVREVNKMKREG